MSRIVLAAVLFIATPAVLAGVPAVAATCPGDIDVRANEGGPVFVNGREAALKTFNANYFEARDEGTGTIVSLTRNADGTVSVTYTGKGRANGVCTVARK
jgi:hypothetical protein